MIGNSKLESVTLPFRSELIKVYPFNNGGFWVHFLDGTKRMMDCEAEIGWFFFNRQDQELADEIGAVIADYIHQRHLISPR